jgi:hypothetical protein
VLQRLLATNSNALVGQCWIETSEKWRGEDLSLQTKDDYLHRVLPAPRVIQMFMHSIDLALVIGGRVPRITHS